MGKHGETQRDLSLVAKGLAAGDAAFLADALLERGIRIRVDDGRKGGDGTLAVLAETRHLAEALALRDELLAAESAAPKRGGGFKWLLKKVGLPLFAMMMAMRAAGHLAKGTLAPLLAGIAFAALTLLFMPGENSVPQKPGEGGAPAPSPAPATNPAPETEAEDPDDSEPEKDPA